MIFSATDYTITVLHPRCRKCHILSWDLKILIGSNFCFLIAPKAHFERRSRRTVVRFLAVTWYISRYRYLETRVCSLGNFLGPGAAEFGFLVKNTHVYRSWTFRNYRVCMRATKSCLPNRPSKKTTDIRICRGFWGPDVLTSLVLGVTGSEFAGITNILCLIFWNHFEIPRQQSKNWLNYDFSLLASCLRRPHAVRGWF